jgi:hypothetical protein
MVGDFARLMGRHEDAVTRDQGFAHRVAHHVVVTRRTVSWPRLSAPGFGFRNGGLVDARR